MLLCIALLQHHKIKRWNGSLWFVLYHDQFILILLSLSRMGGCNHLIIISNHVFSTVQSNHQMQPREIEPVIQMLYNFLKKACRNITTGYLLNFLILSLTVLNKKGRFTAAFAFSQSLLIFTHHLFLIALYKKATVSTAINNGKSRAYGLRPKFFPFWKDGF